MRAISVSVLVLFVFLFDDLSRCVGMEEEKTLAMIKPDGLSGNYTRHIKNIILEYGFCIELEKMLHLNKETVTLFYTEHSERSFFPDLVKYMSSGPVYVMVLKKLNAISDWRYLIGPTDARKAKVSHPNSVRAMCGLDSERNCVHGSDSPESAAREITFFFGEISADPESREGCHRFERHHAEENGVPRSGLTDTYFWRSVYAGLAPRFLWRLVKVGEDTGSSP